MGIFVPMITNEEEEKLGCLKYKGPFVTGWYGSPATDPRFATEYCESSPFLVLCAICLPQKIVCLFNLIFCTVFPQNIVTFPHSLFYLQGSSNLTQINFLLRFQFLYLLSPWWKYLVNRSKLSLCPTDHHSWLHYIFNNSLKPWQPSCSWPSSLSSVSSLMRGPTSSMGGMPGQMTRYTICCSLTIKGMSGSRDQN